MEPVEATLRGVATMTEDDERARLLSLMRRASLRLTEPIAVPLHCDLCGQVVGRTWSPPTTMRLIRAPLRRARRPDRGGIEMMTVLDDRPDRCVCTDAALCLYHWSLQHHSRRRRNAVDGIRPAESTRARPGRLPSRVSYRRHEDET
jgi:hypothetical protein